MRISSSMVSSSSGLPAAPSSPLPSASGNQTDGSTGTGPLTTAQSMA